MEITVNYEQKAGGIHSVSSDTGPGPVTHFWMWTDRHNVNEDDPLPFSYHPEFLL